ncbi:HDIG domain-containing protein [Candidatus Sumerlaeota bacterium]|nr:HDIG domain-containing protein [Candidatus Sumerlaeota bacterium]
MPPGKTNRRSGQNGHPDTKTVVVAKPATARKSDVSESRTVRLADRATRWVALGAVFLVAVLLAVPALVHRAPEPISGGKAVGNIRAAVTFSVPDVAERERLEEEILARSKFCYRYDKSAQALVARSVKEFLERADYLSTNYPERAPSDLGLDLAKWSAEKLGVDTGGALASGLLLAKDPAKLEEAVGWSLEAVYVQRGVVEDLDVFGERGGQGRIDLATPRGVRIDADDLTGLGDVAQFVEDRLGRDSAIQGLSAEDASLVAQLVARFARPNIVFLPEKTERRLQSDLAALNPLIAYEKGSILVPQGRTIGPEEGYLIDRMYEAEHETLLKRLFAVALVIILLCGLVFYYVRQFRSDLSFNTRNILLVSLPVLFSLALGRLSIETVRSQAAAPYLFPAGLIGMLGVIILDARTALVLVIVGSLAFAIPTGLDFKVFLTSLLGGYAAVTALTTVKERRAVLGAGLIVGVVNAVVILLVNFIDDPRALRFDLMFAGVINGLACGVLAAPSLVVFEHAFGVVTDIRLLELTGLDHPLLQELEEKAPGSYQHSLSVCKLSEAAAKAIDANYLLVRAGAYYHDIGKILKPTYFGENQITLEEKSLHGKISPYMSAMVIKNHVKAGIDLARQHRLPQRVIDFIPEHQGTTIISYFYHEALKRFENSESTDPVREDDFRYPGPKPQSVETAIVMLADTVEATVTSRFTSLSVNEDELRMVVKKNVSDRFNDGQFDECELTLRDLHLIRESFVKTLLGRFHHRVKYPSKPSLSGPAAPSVARDRLERAEA